MDDKDNSSSDPWAGIDAGGPAEPVEDFAFSLDDVGESVVQPGLEGLADLAAATDIGLDAVAADEVVEEPLGTPLEVVEESIFPMMPNVDGSHAAVPAGVFSLDPPADLPAPADDDPFAALEPDTDLPGFADSDSGSENTDATDTIGSWLEEPVLDAVEDQPLAVFPGDDLHEQDADAAHSLIQSSGIQIGTGQSGIVSSSDVIPIDEWADTAAESVVDQPGDADQSGIVSEDEALAFQVPEFAAPEFEDAAFGEDEIAGAAAGAIVAAGAGLSADTARKPAALPAAKKKPRAPKPAKSQGGIGQMIGIVLGGLMALPITYAILVWGFQRDPFKFAKMVPAEVAFLLPEKFQPGFKKPLASGSGPQLDRAASLDELPGVTAGGDAAVAEPPAEPAAATELAAAEPAAEKPAVADLFSEKPAPEEFARPAAPTPEPLDYSALEAAIDKAEESFAELAAVADPEDPARKKLLVGWYKNLAGVAEQLVMLETVAADSARPLEKIPEQMEAVYGGIVGNETTIDDLDTLSGMWLKSKKRPVDGAMLLATFNRTRQVGPYWSSLITISGPEPRSVAIISRREPAAAAGDPVLVTGVLFDGDVLWATDCRRLETGAAAEDLF